VRERGDWIGWTILLVLVAAGVCVRRVNMPELRRPYTLRSVCLTLVTSTFLYCIPSAVKGGINPLEQSGNHIHHQLLTISNAAFCMWFGMTLSVNSVNQLIFVMVKCGVLFEVRTEFSIIMKTGLVSMGLIML
jgi:hypothetical protein